MGLSNPSSRKRVLSTRSQHRTHHSKMVSPNASTGQPMNMHSPCYMMRSLARGSGQKPTNMPHMCGTVARLVPYPRQPRMKLFMAINQMWLHSTSLVQGAMFASHRNLVRSSTHIHLMAFSVALKRDQKHTKSGSQLGINLLPLMMSWSTKRCSL